MKSTRRNRSNLKPNDTQSIIRDFTASSPTFGSDKKKNIVLKGSPEEVNGNSISTKKKTPDSARKAMKGFLRHEGEQERRPTVNADTKAMMRGFVSSGDETKNCPSLPESSLDSRKIKKNTQSDTEAQNNGITSPTPTPIMNASIIYNSLDMILQIIIILLYMSILLSAMFYLFLIQMNPHQNSLYGTFVLERFYLLGHELCSRLLAR